MLIKIMDPETGTIEKILVNGKIEFVNGTGCNLHNDGLCAEFDGPTDENGCFTQYSVPVELIVSISE